MRRHLGFPLWLPLLIGVILFLAGNMVAVERRARSHRQVRQSIERLSQPIVWKLV